MGSEKHNNNNNNKKKEVAAASDLRNMVYEEYRLPAQKLDIKFGYQMPNLHNFAKTSFLCYAKFSTIQYIFVSSNFTQILQAS